MKKYLSLTLTIVALFLGSNIKAQLTADAGTDTSICAGMSVVLGGNPTASLGTGPYTYQWSPAAGISSVTCPNPTASPASHTRFTVTVTDALNNTSVDSIDVFVRPNPNIDSVPVINATCNSLSDGCLVVFSSGGQSPYQYSINGGAYQPSDTFHSLSSGGYLIQVTDATGCVDTASTAVGNSYLIAGTVGVANTTCFGSSNGQANFDITGNDPFFYYSIDSGITYTNTLNGGGIYTGLAPGNYVGLAHDMNGCHLTLPFTIGQPDSLIIDSFAISNASNCASNSGSLCVFFSGGNPLPGYTTYAWNNGFSSVSSNCIANLPMGTYGVTVTDYRNCSASASAAILQTTDQCVWPGDANYSGLVDNNDLLYIGLAYGATGYARSSATLDYVPQYCQNWTDSLQDSVNYKHIDCDGNGVINADDTVAILLNFGLPHARSGGQPDWRAGAPVFKPVVQQDTVLNGDTLVINLVLGDANTSADNVYGIAFTLNYDPIPVDTSKTRVLFGNSWMGDATDKISIVKDFKETGQLKCALTRINHVSRSGAGPIGSAMFVITTDNINGKDYMYYTMNVSISDVLMVDSLGNPLQFNLGNGSSEVGYLPTGINDPVDISSQIQMFPNPTKDQLVITGKQLIITEVKITDVTGQVVLNHSLLSTHYSLTDVSALSAGVYFVSVVTNKGVSTQRLIISH